MEKIFHEWKQKNRHQGKVFITDGAIDEENWKKSNFKILFLLKEAYGKEKHLPDLVRKVKAKGRTFKPISQWAYGLQSIVRFGEIKDFLEKGSNLNDALMSSAIINIKKSQGKKSSKSTNLAIYAEEDWDLIELQIKILKPDIIICGKTWSLIKNKLTCRKKISDRVYTSNGFTFVDFWHPANRASNVMNYYALCALVYNYKKSFLK